MYDMYVPTGPYVLMYVYMYIYMCVYTYICIKHGNFIFGDVVPWCVYQLNIYFPFPTNATV
jgi:hypothetical protein